MKTHEQSIGDYDSKKKTEKYFEAVKGGSEEAFEGVDANVFRYLKDNLPKDFSSKKILDVGSGDGRWSEYFSKLGGEIFAIDKSPAMIELAKKRIEEKGLENIHLIQGNMNALPLDEQSVDIAFSSFSMMYFENLENLLGEIGKTVKPGGKIYIATNIFLPNGNGSVLEKIKGQNIPVNLGFEKKIPLENLVQPLEQYEKGLKDAGFSIDICEYFEPEGVEIDEKCEYKKDLVLKKAVLIATKI